MVEPRELTDAEKEAVNPTQPFAGEFTPLTVENWADYYIQYISRHIPEYELAYVRTFLNRFINAVQDNVDGKRITEVDAAQRLAEVVTTLQTQGITSPYLSADKELRDLGVKEIADRLKDYIKGAATPVTIDGKNYLAIGGYFYNTTADRLPQELQTHLTQRATDLGEQAKVAEESIGDFERGVIGAADWETIKQKDREIAARREYMGQQKWWEKEGSEQIVGATTMWKPEQAVGLSPEEAIRQGYASYTPEGQFDNEEYSRVFQEALQAEAWRFIGGKKPGAPGVVTENAQEVRGQVFNTYGDVWKALTQAQQDMIKQKALQAGAGQPTLYTAKELRDYSKQGIDVSAASKALTAYQKEHPQQGVPYSQRGGDGMHIHELKRRQAAAAKKAEEWEKLKAKSLTKWRIAKL